MKLSEILAAQPVISTATATAEVDEGSTYARIAAGAIVGEIAAAEIHESAAKPGSYSLHVTYAGPVDTTPQNGTDTIGMFADVWYDDRPYLRPNHYMSLTSSAQFCRDQLARFFKALEDSNPGWTYTDFLAKGSEEAQLIGLKVGIILGYEQYEKNNGTIGERLIIKQVCSVSAAKNNTYVPKLRELKSAPKPSTVPTAAAEPYDDDLPF